MCCRRGGMGCRHWCKLTSLSAQGAPAPCMPVLVATFVALLEHAEPGLEAHLAAVCAFSTRDCAVAWLARGFVGVLDVEEVCRSSLWPCAHVSRHHTRAPVDRRALPDAYVPHRLPCECTCDVCWGRSCDNLLIPTHFLISPSISPYRFCRNPSHALWQRVSYREPESVALVSGLHTRLCPNSRGLGMLGMIHPRFNTLC